MAQDQPLVFSNIPPAQYAQLIERARANGVELSGNSGTASRLGVEIRWNYSPETKQLTLECMKAPFIMSKAAVYAKLKSVVDDSLSAS